MTKHYKLALLGFGNVGQALAELLDRKQASILEEFDVSYSIVAVATGSHGRAINENGIDGLKAVSLMKSGDSLNSLSKSPAPEDNLEFIKASEASILFENTPVSYSDGQPAISHIEIALKLGMHVSTANKGPVVHGKKMLTDIANEMNRKFYFESTVMDGAPVFALLRETLPAAEIISVRGVLNSTTNLILSMMEEGKSFDDAVKYAQDIGIAETDPSGDVDGWDAAIKISALVSIYMNTPMTPEMVDRTGIRDVTPGKIAEAKSQGKRWKLVCEAWRQDGKILTKVAPQMVGTKSPMYTVDGSTSIVQIKSDVLGELSLIESDPGPHTTAYGLLADFLNSVKE
jgi:homoserine dehydrogenase